MQHLQPRIKNLTMDNDRSFEQLAGQINSALEGYDDEAWHYSRLRLIACPLQEIPGEKVLWVETIATDTRDGERMLRELEHRVGAAVGHLSELSIIQIIICRMNKALLDHTSDVFWKDCRPFITWAKKTELAEQGLELAFWYNVEERLSEEDELE